MIAPTHVTFAEFFYLLILTAVGIPLSAAHAAVVAVASVLPDIDTPASSIGRLLPPLSSRLERLYGHRTLTHSLLGMAAVGLAALPLAALGRELYLCFVAGYVSHPLLDTMTVTGVRLFHPFSSAQCVFPFDAAAPRRYRVTTGSTADKALALFFAAACAPMLFLARDGYERAIRIAQGSIEAAVRDYTEFSGSHLVVVSLEASEALSRSPLQGNFPVAGALNAQTLLFRGPDGELHTLGKPFQSEYVAARAVCTRSAPVHWQVRAVDLSGRLLGQASEEADGAEECYLFGSLVLDEDVSLPSDPRNFRPVGAHANMLTLNFATQRDIDRLGLDDHIVLNGILTVKARYADGRAPGAAAADRYAHLAFGCAAGESLLVLARVGETVRAGSVIARKIGGPSAAERISINHESMKLLEARLAADEASARRKIALAESSLAIDSAELAAGRVLAGSGYLSRAPLSALELRVEKARGALQALRASAERSASATALQIRRLRARNSELGAARARQERQTLFRSDVEGMVTSIRRRTAGGRTLVSFVVRRLERRR